MKRTLLPCVALMIAATFAFACSFTTDFEMPANSGDGVDTQSSNDDTSSDDNPSCSGCLIAGFCFPEGVFNPQNICQVCMPGVAADAWSDNDGQTCDDGLFCTEGDACLAGQCVGTDKDCDDGIACNDTEYCDEVIDQCVLGSSNCPGDSVCDVQQDVCVTTCSGCSIDGMCYTDQQQKSNNECQKCDRSVSIDHFTMVADDTPCDDGNFCTVSTTCTDGFCQGTFRDCDDGIWCNGSESCSAQQCLPSGENLCTGGKICIAPAPGQCVFTCPGCLISSTCYNDGEPNLPFSDCQVCEVATSDTDWTDKAEGDPCTGGTCGGGASSGECCTDCNISGTCYAESDTDPTSECRICETATSTSSWTDKSDLDPCAGGTGTCGSGECCNDCNIANICYAEGDTDPSSDCRFCEEATSPSSWTDKTEGDPCTGGTCGGGASSGECCTDCNIGGICYAENDTDPTEECRICETAATDTDWTELDGVPCSGGAQTCILGVCT